MQQVNDDMDELYKRAAEDYPLNTGSADWNAVLKKLEAERSIKAGASKNKHYRHLLWLLLLLPLGLVYKNYFSPANKPVHTVSNNIPDKQLTDAALSKKSDPSVNAVHAPQVVDETQNTISQQVKNPSVIQRKHKGKLNTVIQNSSVTVIPGNLSKVNQEDKPGKKENEVVAEVQKVSTESKNETTLTPPEKKTDNVLTNKEEAVKNSPKKNQKHKERGLYVGIIVSPDISTVKLQSVKDIGISMGILAGYQLNKKISIESGVSWSIKNYYSKGESFSTNNIYLLPGAKIKNVEGECNMIEVPLIVKYNFRSSGKNALSGSAGVSSYFMKKEDYKYEIERNGQQYPYSRAYKNTSSDLFAVANIAVGYNRHLNKNITLRIEPYLKIPLKGVGIGELPITSTGINIGITKKLSR